MKKKAFTLVEVMVVTAIILVVLAVLGLAIGSRVKISAMETAIRSDLKQIATAIAIYRADYDDRYPLSYRNLPPSVPRKLAGGPNPFTVGECPRGEPNYFYPLSKNVQVFLVSHRSTFPFDTARHAVIKASFYYSKRGEWSTAMPGNRPMEIPSVLGARVDGSISWFPIFEDYELDFAHNRWR